MTLSRRNLLAAALLAASGVLLRCPRPAEPPRPGSSSIPRPKLDLSLGKQTDSIEATERRIGETLWAQEFLAQSYGRRFDDLWDAVNAASNKLQTAAAFSFGRMVWGRWAAVATLPHGITLHHSQGPLKAIPAAEWRAWIEDRRQQGWVLDQVEFRHVAFDSPPAQDRVRSRFWFSAHVHNTPRRQRAQVQGNLEVDWDPRPPGSAHPAVQTLDPSGLTVVCRDGEPFFQPILADEVGPPGKSPFIDPLILYDLDGDGHSEILLPAANRRYGLDPNLTFACEPLCQYPEPAIATAVVADINKDGSPDLLAAVPRGLLLFPGSPRGTFDAPALSAWSAPQALINPMTLTCGDIDHDGDLDVFLGQYRVPRIGQILRPTYYDANDSYPSFLLQNDGHGRFSEITGAGGLGPKRWRRTFAASFVDLNRDRHLDLLITSDFAGADLYANDGRGHFTDVTAAWFDDPRAFGMSHALADFNADGVLDFLLVGMNSPTVDRLEHLGLHRPDPRYDPALRRRMTYGNRLVLGQPAAGFQQTALSDSIARTGWSWGASAFDFDNDGFPDLYIANGHESRQSVREYEPEFWLHDLFIGPDADEHAATAYFISRFERRRSLGLSYGGHEKNRLGLNRQGAAFIDIAHLADLALENDSRNVVADDIDGDGRVDLLLITSEVWPRTRQTLRVFRNTLADPGHWIAFRFREAPERPSPVGVQVTLDLGPQRAVGQIVTGDGFRSQHANTLHFGLGAIDRVDQAVIGCTDGRTLTLDQPAQDRCHLLPAPAAPTRPGP